jgi:hypothetical protein
VGAACTVLEDPAKREDYNRELASRLGIELKSPEHPGRAGAAPEGKACPSCGAAMSQVSTYCIECGYDQRVGEIVRTGYRLQVSADRGRVVRVGGPAVPAAAGGAADTHASSSPRLRGRYSRYANGGADADGSAGKRHPSPWLKVLMAVYFGLAFLAAVFLFVWFLFADRGATP